MTYEQAHAKAAGMDDIESGLAQAEADIRIANQQLVEAHIKIKWLEQELSDALLALDVRSQELTDLNAKSNAWLAVWDRWKDDPRFLFVAAELQRQQCASAPVLLNAWIEGLVEHWEND